MVFTVREEYVDDICDVLSDFECNLLRSFVEQINNIAKAETDEEEIARRQSEVALAIAKIFGATFLVNLDLVEESAEGIKTVTFPEDSEDPDFEISVVKLKTGYYILSATSTSSESFEVYLLSKNYSTTEKIVREIEDFLKNRFIQW